MYNLLILSFLNSLQLIRCRFLEKRKTGGKRNLDYHVNIYWDKGKVRKINQDSIIVLKALTCRGRVFMAAVCDGMGGMDWGEGASGYVVEELVTWFYDDLISAIGKKKPLWVIRRSLERKVYQMQGRIKFYAQKHNVAMGTTMSVLVLWEKRYLLWHLGDSRIYQLRRKKIGKRTRIKQLTKDHVQEENKLTRCVGSFGFFVPDFKMGIAHKREAFLLCSDGFFRRLQEAEIWEVLQNSRMETENGDRRLKELAEAALRRGEKDNLSAVYISTMK
ncbi:MAG: serine/threonine-protein phosphatase [Lachnospiraceae bacterium]|nr:serine/threonine-protein phosphatase [Lachnospiraceae bacterium]